MHAILIWILINVNTGQPVSQYQFPTQSDCIRAGTQLNQYGRFHAPYICQSLRVVDPYGTAADPNSAQLNRARRNAQFEQDHMNAIITGQVPVLH
jgi:hypothetical protein